MASNASPFNIPGMLDGWIRSQNGIPDPITAYEKVPLIMRAVQMSANDLSYIPHGLTDQNDDELEWPFPSSSARMLWIIEASLRLRGEAFIQKMRRGDRVINLRPLNAFSVTVEVLPGTVEPRFYQWIDGRKFPQVGYWTLDDIIYIREYSPRYDIGETTSSAKNALRDAALLNALTEMPDSYFRGGTMPITVISGFPAGTRNDEVARYESFFARMANGLANIGRVLGVKGDVKIATLTPPMREMAIPDLYSQSMGNIAWSFGIPEARLRDASTYATAEVHERQYFSSTVLPRADLIADALNRQAFNDSGLEFQFYPEKMTIFQTEELERASSISAYTAQGLTLTEACEVLGVELPQHIIDRLESAPPPAAPPPAPETTVTVDAMQSWRKAALTTVGAGVGSPFDNELAQCTTKSETRAVFERHWPKPSSELTRLAEALENATKAVTG